MPRKAQWPPKIFKHPTGQDRVRIRGKDYYLGLTGSEEARAAYARLVASIAAGQEPARMPLPPKPAAAPTVARVVAEWWTKQAPAYSTAGREQDQYRRSLAPLLRLFAPLPAAEFGRNQLKIVQLAMASGEWMNDQERERAQKRREPIGWCRNVVNRRVVRIRTVWRWAEEEELVPPGAWAGLCALPGLRQGDARVRHTPEPVPATWEEVRAVVKRAPAPVKAMILLQWWAGLRSGEVRTMTAAEIDRNDPEVWIYRPVRHKNAWRGHKRNAPLGPKCRAILGPWLARAASADAYLFPPSRRRKGGRDHYSDCGYAQAVRRAAAKAGLPEGWHSYLCRHACKDRIKRAEGLDTARAILGQRSIQTTNDYGDALDLEQARNAARRLG